MQTRLLETLVRTWKIICEHTFRICNYNTKLGPFFSRSNKKSLYFPRIGYQLKFAAGKIWVKIHELFFMEKVVIEINMISVPFECPEMNHKNIDPVRNHNQIFQVPSGGGTSPLQNGLSSSASRRTPPKENGNGSSNEHAKKEPVSPRSGRSSASSTPAPTKKSSSNPDDKPTTPKPTTPNGAAPAAPGSGALKPGLPAPPFGLPGFPPIPPGAPFSAENGYRPPFDPHPALRTPIGMPPGGKP